MNSQREDNMSYYEWQQDLLRFYDVMTPWFWNDAERYRRYNAWKEVRLEKKEIPQKDKDS